MQLRIVSRFPDFFAINGRDAMLRGEGFGCQCAECGRAVTAPFGYERALVWCLYCGMRAGYVPMVEPEWGFRWTFGVTREEAVEDRKALDRGNYSEVAEGRARREGRVVVLF